MENKIKELNNEINKLKKENKNLTDELNNYKAVEKEIAEAKELYEKLILECRVLQEEYNLTLQATLLTKQKMQEEMQQEIDEFRARFGTKK